MARVNNLNDFLTDVADAIRTKKETTEQIPAENFDQEILSIETGIDTSDANAIAENIEEGKTAYVNGEKITGTANTWDTNNRRIFIKQDGITVVEPSRLETKGRLQFGAPISTISKTGSSTVLLRGTNEAEISATQEDVANAINLTPEKLVKGNTILGVEGTAETGGSEINNQDKEITTNGTYTADEGYTGLGTVTVNVPQKVQLFENENAMNAWLLEHYSEVQNGDAAVIYGEDNIWPVGNGQYTQSIYLPEKIVLDEPLDRTLVVFNGTKYANGGGGGNSNITPTNFSWSIRLNMSSASFSYTSEDGQTYIRSGTPTIHNFGWGSNGKFVWDSDNNMLNLTETTTSFFYYKAVNGGTKYLTQFFRSIKPTFDGVYKITTVDSKIAPKVSQNANNLINGTIANTEPHRAYIGNTNWSTSCDMMGIKIGTKMYMGEECDEFDILYRGNNYPTTFLYYDGKLRMGYFSSYTTSTGTGTATYTYYTYKNGIETKYTKTFDLPSQSYKYVSGSYTYAFCEIFSTDDIENCRILTVNSSLRYYTALGTTYTTVNRNSNYSYYIAIPKYIVADTQMSLQNSNQLLPGITGYGTNQSYTGDESVYKNLDTYEVNKNIFGLTEDSRSGNNLYYGINPKQYISDITDKTKMYFLKHNDFTNNSNHYIGEVSYDNIDRMTATSVYTNVLNTVYNKERDMLISTQRLTITAEDGTKSYEYHVVFENATTHEILYDTKVTAPDGYEYYYIESSKNAVYLHDGGTYNSNANQFFKCIAYDLDTFAMTTIMDKSTTYNSNSYYHYRYQVKVIDNRYCFAFCSWQLNSSTCYYYAYMYDDVSKTNRTIINGTTATTSGASYSNHAELKTLICGDTIYVMCSWGYLSQNRIHLYKVVSTDTSYTFNTLRTSTSSAVDGYDVNDSVGIDLDNNYLFWQNYWLSKTDSSVGGILNYSITDTSGNVISEKSSIQGMFNINETNYVYNGRCIFKIDSYSLSGQIAGESGTSMCNIIVSEVYRIPVTQTLTYINNNVITDYSVNMDYSTFTVNNDYTYDIDFKSKLLYGHFKFIPCKESTSLDFDYSTFYGGYDHLIQRSVQSDGVLSVSDYTTAMNTANDILGEEE